MLCLLTLSGRTFPCSICAAAASTESQVIHGLAYSAGLHNLSTHRTISSVTTLHGDVWYLLCTSRCVPPVDNSHIQQHRWCISPRDTCSIQLHGRCVTPEGTRYVYQHSIPRREQRHRVMPRHACFIQQVSWVQRQIPNLSMIFPLLFLAGLHITSLCLAFRL